MATITTQNLGAFFCEPSAPPSELCPQRLPGADEESINALLHVLKDNHQKYHIFFNHQKFHNHITHRALALYALGAPGPLIQAYYDYDGNLQRPAFRSPGEITKENFVEHLADEDYYSAYLDFFAKEVQTLGSVETLEKYVFSDEYNVSQAFMLARYWGAVLHPAIHAGYGLEFGIPGMAVEGLAMAAVTPIPETELLGASFFKTIPALDPTTQSITSKVSTLLLGPGKSASKPDAAGTTAVFDILARILKDDRLGPHKTPDMFAAYGFTVTKRGPLIREYADSWTIDTLKSGEIERKMEELFWMNTLIYAVGGWSEEEFKADFLYMHLVTSALFLPSHIAHLSPRSQIIYLRSFLTMSLTTWIMRGRAPLPLTTFWTATSPSSPTHIPLKPGTLSLNFTAPPAVPAAALANPNPWLAIVHSAIVHENDHYAKIVCAFMHCARVYGARPAGWWVREGEKAELEGLGVLDGSLFLRAAELTAVFQQDENKVHGLAGQRWDFRGFGC
ncbi:hypothetical protein CONPUDRAFT_140309 [Coniophora puteana RWD-64-598 SS2]|uniref:Oxidoreductase AflY n=1 Tax=Coniophora puteana (strain RWD-64-598) TaxID=741705 RepID=A0A5M3M817_CONPW|nr:uncharacterized protein CONPUDRAFT_140309 [Coniophora puteana RWD-64-598 SS2]EIW74935.1 hypothetical protein CONPUDRAFT_140309 [Coniophora puteana RWD-64-598 SS2]